VVHNGNRGLSVPEPGHSAGVESLSATGESDSFQIEVAADGTISYPEGTMHTGTSGVTGGGSDSESVTGADPIPSNARPACEDDTWVENDLKEYGTWTWWLGDGGMPGGLSQLAAQAAFADGINNVTGESNDCSMTHLGGMHASYGGLTSYESDIDNNGNCGA
jgi:hypothetical protein